eukprot:6188095-Pleurochrysis_carterae.AAC.3
MVSRAVVQLVASAERAGNGSHEQTSIRSSEGRLSSVSTGVVSRWLCNGGSLCALSFRIFAVC